MSILLKRSFTTGSIPTTSSLLPGEIANNVPDGKIFLRKSGSGSDSIQTLIATGTNNSGSVQLTGSLGVSGSGDVLVVNGDVLEFSGDLMEFTGSFVVTGSTTITGSLSAPNITGSLFGTASWALNTLTASYLSGSSLTSSYALTASSADNFIVRGTLTAQTIVAQTITASTEYVTGSSRFGSSLTNTHQFTGSVSITGSLTSPNITGSLLGTSSWSTNALTASYVPASAVVGLALNQIATGSVTASVNTGGGSFTLTSGSSNYIYVSSSGNVGINNTAPSVKLQVSGSVLFSSSGSSIFAVDGTLGRLLQIDDVTSGSLFAVNTIAGFPIIEAFSDSTVRIGQYGQKALYISQSAVGIGKETPLNGILDVSGSVSITGSLNAPTITGSLFGTASWATNALTSSYILNAVSSSYSLSASNAATASYANNFTISGSLNLSSFTTGSVLFAGISGTISQDNSNLFWDNANKRLGIGTSTPSYALHVVNNSGLFVQGVGSSAGGYVQFTPTVGNALTLSSNVLTISPLGSLTLSSPYISISNTVGHGDINIKSKIYIGDNNSGGKVGINTTTPAYQFDVNGASRFSGNSIITGSLTVTAGITGSLFGTASWAINALTASNIIDGVSASYALTASSADNFLVRGTLTAQTIVSQTITSSTEYITGSTQFGSTGSNTHQFTGSVSISGSLTAPNITGSLQGTASWANNSLTASYVPASAVVGLALNQIATGSISASVNTNSGSFTVTSGSNTYLFVSSSGYLGVNTSNPTSLLTVNGASEFNGNMRLYGQNILSVSTATLAPRFDIGPSYLTLGGGAGGNNFLFLTQYGYGAYGQLYSTWGLYLGASSGIAIAIQGTTRNIQIQNAGTFTDNGYRLSVSGSGGSGSFMVIGTSNLVGETRLSGSYHEVTGSLNAPVITGSLFGTASWALNSLTASTALTALTASNVIGGVTASYALTASSADNFLVRGTLTAQTIVAQTITASTEYVTGSTQFGSTVNNTHQFTGSVSITGSLTSPNITGSLLGTASWANQAVSSSYSITSSYPLLGVITGSVNINTLTFTKGDGSSFNLVISQSGSVATASYAIFAETSSISTSSSYALTASYALNAGVATTSGSYTGSFSGSMTGSLLGTSSWATNALTASYITASNIVGLNVSRIATGSVTASVGVNPNTFQITSGSSTFLYISSSGVTGLGTSSPITTLHVNQVAGTTKGILISGDEVYQTGNGTSTDGIRISAGVNRSGNRQLWIGDNSAYGSSTLSIFRYSTGNNGFAVIDAVTGDGLSRLLTVLGTETSNVGIGADGAGPTVASYTAKLSVFVYNESRTSLLLRKAGTGVGNFIDAVNNGGILKFSVDVNGGLFAAGGAYITGSLIASGSSHNITGSLNAPTITGSLFGTASWASSSLTASNSISSSYAQTSSWAISSFTASSADNFIVRNNLTASAMLISGSGTQRLTVIGSGSAQSLFAVQGSQGELFSIYDSLSGSLFSVNDISGLPVVEVFSDSTVLMGNYSAPALYTTSKLTTTNSGSFVVYSVSTGSYDGMFVDYVAKSGSNSRAGTIVALWSGSSANWMDNSTTDFGDTTSLIFSAIVSGSNLVVTGSVSSGFGWTVKSIIKSI